MDKLRRRIFIGLPLAVPSLAHAMASSAHVRPAAGSSLSIDGALALSTELSVRSLRASPLGAGLPPIALTTCTGAFKRNLTGYRGIKLTDLLDQARIEAPDHNSVKRTYVVASARDNYTVMFSWSELYNSSVGPGVFVLVDRDGQELPDSEGPLALISREDLRTGPRHVRWLKSIEVRHV